MKRKQVSFSGTAAYAVKQLKEYLEQANLSDIDICNLYCFERGDFTQLTLVHRVPEVVQAPTCTIKIAYVSTSVGVGIIMRTYDEEVTQALEKVDLDSIICEARDVALDAQGSARRMSWFALHI
jgi:hypothetical protein